jgi:hypothetical protein
MLADKVAPAGMLGDPVAVGEKLYKLQNVQQQAPAFDSVQQVSIAIPVTITSRDIIGAMR